VTYTVLVYEADPEEGGYWAVVAELPGCGTSGETIEGNRGKHQGCNRKDAIEMYLDALNALGKPPPQAATRKLEVSLA
jgi:predicted RNase H-like HicB family nuclease